MMIRKLAKYLIIILVFCGVLFCVSFFNNDISNEHPITGDMIIHTDSNIQSTDSINLYLRDTIIPKDETIRAELFSDDYYILLVNDTTDEIHAAKNVHNRMYPASMTKLLTAIVVCDNIESGNISLDDEVPINYRYDLTSEQGGFNDFTVGAKITVKNLLFGLLISSNNYYALYLGDYIAGDLDSFYDMLNAKAYDIGATNTHFSNPHGLDAIDHYSTPYDMYLITKEANSHELIREASSYTEYDYEYINSNGYPIEVHIEATNMFLSNHVSLPASYHIETWKTGTTDAAGYCLTMYLNKNDNDYVAIVANSVSRHALYDDMVRLLSLIGP